MKSITRCFFTAIIVALLQCDLVQSKAKPNVAFLATIQYSSGSGRNSGHIINVFNVGWRLQPANRPSPSALLYSSDGKVSSKSNDAKLLPKVDTLPAYRTVAEQDPEWYETYVMNVLGAEKVKEIGLPPPVPRTLSSAPPKHTESKAKRNSEVKVAEKTELFKDGLKVKKPPDQDTLSKKSTKVEAQREDPPNKMTEIKERAKENVLSSTTTEDDCLKSVITESTRTDTEDDTMILYQDPSSNTLRSVPLVNLTELGYRRDDIFQLQPDVVALIVADQVRIPKMGIPSRWRRPASENLDEISSRKLQIVSQEKAKELLKFARSNEAMKKAGRPTKASKPAKFSKEQKSEKNFVSRSSKESSNTTSLQFLSADELLVMYKDSVSGISMATPLVELTNLGYTQEEIVRLQPDVLDLIMAGQVPRPHSELPPNWQRLGSSSMSDIEVLTRSAYDQLTDKKDETLLVDTQIPKRTEPEQSVSKLEVLSKQGSGQLLSKQEAVSAVSKKDYESKQESGPILSDQSVSKQETIKKETHKKVEPVPSQFSDAVKYADEQETVAASKQESSKKTEVTTQTDKSGKAATIKAAVDSIETDMNENKETVAEIDPEIVAPVEAKGASTVEVSENSSEIKSEPVAKSKIIQGQYPELRPTKAKDTPETVTREIEEAPEPQEDDARGADEFVVFFDYAKGRKQAVPVKEFILLGYTTNEVVDLQADVLATILVESTTKPRTGVPPQWRISKAKPREGKPEVVQLLSRKQAEKAMKMEPTTTKASVSDELPREEADTVDTIRVRPSPRESRNASEPPKRRRRKARSHEKRAFNSDGTKKSMYSVRPGPSDNNRQRTADPPPNKYWMDIDTFRNLLRSEAELRMNILGGRFSKAIKDESDWRLNLYKDWLWTLDKGLGKPIVPSRRERTMQDSSASTKAKPTTRSRSGRSRPSENRNSSRRPRSKP